MKRNSNFILASIIAILGMILLGGTSCSTSKNNAINRAYHNVTCKYNVLWNGQQTVRDAEAELKKISKDNFTALLPVYTYPDKTTLGPVLPHIDRIIEKSSKAIYKHSMLIHGKEYVKTIDDAYLIMGKAYFYRQDYVQAQRIFNYILSNYPKANTYGEAGVMLARTSLRQQYYASANEQLENLHYLATNRKNKKFNILFNAAKAEHCLTVPDGDMQEAIDYLNGVIEAKPNREFKSRMYLIIGELYEIMGQQAEAQKNFAQVIKKSADYEMTFCAQMHLASNYDGSDASRTAIMKQFKKMLNEKRNEDYRDQIYYACSEIARIDEDDTLRKQYLAKSVAAYTTNNYQRTFSSLTLADLYFDEDEYRKAQAYYDTATLTVPKNYPNYDEVIRKSNVLKDLVLKLDEVDLQDSLQRIARMSSSQRTAWVRKMIADYTEAERKAQQEEAERQLAMQNAASYTNVNVTSSNGKWYFYNQSLVIAGQQDFMRRFGPRKLEDNWLVSNKQQISMEDIALMNDPDAAKDSVQYDEEGNPIQKRETDPKKEAYYLQDLPMTPGALDTSNRIICNNLYEIGFIYQDLLHDIHRANEIFETLLRRFPDGEFVLPCTYLLYLNYMHANDPKSDIYKNIILTKYADTDYAKLIEDPTYYRKLAEKEKEYERCYEQLYDDFNQRQWISVVQTADRIIPQCTDPELQSKYAYLRAIAAGQIYNQDTLIQNLTSIISLYSSTEVAKLAHFYLSTFSTDKLAQSLPHDTMSASLQLLQDLTGNKQKEIRDPFVFKANEMHYIILIVESANLPVMTVKTNISKFNKKYFSLRHLNVSSFYINNTQQMITIAKFNNDAAAMEYYNILSKDENFSGDIANGNIQIYAMSSTNYTTYYNNREGRKFYNDFHERYYLHPNNTQQ